MIEAKQASKSYAGQRVLDGASLSASPGQCVVLTGDNGSGKTTLLNAMVGLRRLDAGQILWKQRVLTGAGARPWRQARASWGFLPQQVTLPGHIVIRRLLHFHARLRGTGVDAPRRWLGHVGLADAEKQRVGTLSGGMRQRLGLALALFFEPELLVMDEPASNLDPGWRDALVDWARQEAQRGAAVLVTSQFQQDWGPRAVYRHCVAGRIVAPGGEGHPA